MRIVIIKARQGSLFCRVIIINLFHKMPLLSLSPYSSKVNLHLFRSKKKIKNMQGRWRTKSASYLQYF